MNLYFLGGSFDPPHLGHLKIAEFCLKKGDLFLFIPTKNSPYKLNQKITSANHRLNMLNLMTTKMDKIKVDPFEIDNDDISYTYKTIEYLLAKYNSYELIMVIGYDHLNTLSRWKNIDYIKNNCKIMCFNRDSSILDYVSNIEIIKDFQISISSTLIREKIKSNNLINMKSLLSKIVIEYIIENNLYK